MRRRERTRKTGRESIVRMTTTRTGETRKLTGECIYLRCFSTSIKCGRAVPRPGGVYCDTRPVRCAPNASQDSRFHAPGQQPR